jgi:Helix-turn-helix domain
LSVQAIAWVLEESESKLAARLVLLSIANHAKADGSNAWPSLDQLALEAGVTRRHAIRCIRELEDLGELGVRRNKGPSGTNRYDLTKMSPGHIVTSDIQGTPGVTSDDVASDTVSPEPSLTVLNRQRFDEWYDVYPKHVGRIAAFKAFARVLRSVDFAVLLEAAERYRDNPKRDRDFTLNPATWLNQGRWEDESIVTPSAPSMVRSAEVIDAEWKQQRAEEDARIAAILEEVLAHA